MYLGRLAKEGARYGLKGVAVDPEEEDMDKLEQIVVNTHSLISLFKTEKGKLEMV
jgi:hypothetical protein